MSTLIALSASESPATSPAGPHRPAAASPHARRERAVPLSPTFRPPYIPGVEAQAEWDAHIRGVVEHYAPDGYVEDACAFRIASLLWRLNRLAQSEVDDLAQCIGESERDACAAIASRAEEPDHIKPILPPDVPALTRCTNDAALAAQVLAGFHNWPNHDPIADDDARAAHYFLSAHYSHSPNNPPPDAPPAGWDGSRLRSALSKLAINRSVYDDVPVAIQFAKDVATAAERRLVEIRALTTRLCRERLVPQSPLSSQIREAESALALQLDQAMEQLDLLQDRRPTD